MDDEKAPTEAEADELIPAPRSKWSAPPDDPDELRWRLVDGPRGYTGEQAYRALAGLPPGPVDVPPLDRWNEAEQDEQTQPDRD